MFLAIRVPNQNIAKQILSDNWQAKPNVTLCQIVQRRYKLHRRAGIRGTQDATQSYYGKKARGIYRNTWQIIPRRSFFHYLYAVQVDLAMEHTNNIDKALSSFKILAATQAAATENGDYKKGNKAFKQIIQIIKYLKGLERVNELEALLSDSNVGVRMFAAFGLLQTYPDVAVHILKEIAQRDDIHSLTANETLKQWESKALIYPF